MGVLLYRKTFAIKGTGQGKMHRSSFIAREVGLEKD